METTTSITKEFYKVQKYWKEIDPFQDWQLAIWIAQYQDVEMIDTFMETECSPMGIFDDIFFRFNTKYTGDIESFDKALWEEYLGWFSRTVNSRTDTLSALEKDGILINEYVPQVPAEFTALSLWEEMLRFRSYLEDISGKHFCIYLPPPLPTEKPLTQWLTYVLETGIPGEIRITTIDYAQNRKIYLPAHPEVAYLTPQLNRIDAIRDEIGDGCDSTDSSTFPEKKFKEQINKLLLLASENKGQEINKEAKLLLLLAKETGSLTTMLSGRIAIAQSYYIVHNDEQSLLHIEKALQDAEELMEAGVPEGYPFLRTAILLKAAILLKYNERKDAIELYELLAEKASLQGDAFYTMEGFRQAGYLYYELNKHETAFETTLLSLKAGSYLEQPKRRESSFLYAAALVLQLGCRQLPSEDLETLEKQLQNWVGNDWKSLVQSKGLKQIATHRKAFLFTG